ncbi:MAG: hypothetical protein ACTSRB_18365 [Candidatus Helarchaeota archaeon]
MTSLEESEAPFLEDLKLVIGKAVPEVQEVGAETFGYVVKNGHITELGLNEVKKIAIPESIGNWTKLEVLYVDINSLSSLPASISQLEKMHTIVLKGNDFKELPEEANIWLKKQF